MNAKVTQERSHECALQRYVRDVSFLISARGLGFVLSSQRSLSALCRNSRKVFRVSCRFSSAQVESYVLYVREPGLSFGMNPRESFRGCSQNNFAYVTIMRTQFHRVGTQRFFGRDRLHFRDTRRRNRKLASSYMRCIKIKSQWSETVIQTNKY